MQHILLADQSLFMSISSFMGSSLVIIYIIVCTAKDFVENINCSCGSMLPVFLVLPTVRILERSVYHVLMPCKKHTLWYKAQTVEQYHPPCSTFTYCARSKQTKILLQLANKPWLKQWTSLAWACSFVYPSPTPSTLVVFVLFVVVLGAIHILCDTDLAERADPNSPHNSIRYMNETLAVRSYHI